MLQKLLHLHLLHSVMVFFFMYDKLADLDFVFYEKEDNYFNSKQFRFFGTLEKKSKEIKNKNLVP